MVAEKSDSLVYERCKNVKGLETYVWGMKEEE